MLAGIAVFRRVPDALFWGVVGLAGLLLSFGANSPVFALLYNTLPGMRYFRGQERAAFLVANSLAILAGMGIIHLRTWKADLWPTATHNLRRALIGLFALCAVVCLLVFTQWLNNRDLLNGTMSTVVFSTVMAIMTVAIVLLISRHSGTRLYALLLAGLLVFELFTVNMDTDSNYDHIPPEQQLSMTPPALVAEVKVDTDLPYRVDGYRGLYDNYGSLYDVMDIRGISPLFLDSTHAIIQSDLINPLAWELFAVKYVFTDWDSLPVPSEIIGNGQDRYGAVNLHRLRDPRPFAMMIYDTVTADSDESARAMMADIAFNPRRTIILNRDVEITDGDTSVSTANVIHFAPEQFAIEVDTSQQGVLSVANPDYPGWLATIDGQSADIIRAYGALQAVIVPPGKHTIAFTFDPISYRAGAIISLFTWGALGILSAVLLTRRLRHARD